MAMHVFLEHFAIIVIAIDDDITRRRLQSADLTRFLKTLMTAGLLHSSAAPGRSPTTK
jgi:hypothetical protein